MHTKIVGVTFENRQNLLKKLKVDDKLQLIREPNNTYDKNAVAVYYGVNQLGYIGAQLAKYIAHRMDAGTRYQCTVSAVTGGTDGNKYGANITLEVI